MRLLLTLALFIICAPAMAEDKTEDATQQPPLDLQCVKKAYETYAQKHGSYWDALSAALRAKDEEVYLEFGYLIDEQQNVMKMNLIVMEYLFKNNSGKLLVHQDLRTFVPYFTNYFQDDFRVLRKDKEYDALFIRNRSYEHNAKMPDMERLKKASDIMAALDKTEEIAPLRNDALNFGKQFTRNITCE